MKASAWIMPITDNVVVAAGEFELVHILPDKPKLFGVPKAPHYCQQVLIWQNKIIPVMNLAIRFGYEITVSNENSIISIFAYRLSTTESIEYGALFINTAPRRIEVADSQACALPADLQVWTPYVWSCFQDLGTQKAIPILRFERLFAHQDKPTV